MAAARKTRSRSGTPTLTNELRNRKMQTFTLSEEAIEKLQGLSASWEIPKSMVVEELILAAKK